jgi:predicted PurR-regulated permease PerM
MAITHEHELERVVQARDLARTLLGVAFLLAMIAGTLWILRPFLAALLWAATIVVATWPILIGLQRRLGGRRGLAVGVMTVLLLLVLIGPFTTAAVALIAHTDAIVGWATSARTLTLPAPPAWLDRLPVVGARLVDTWQQLAAPGAISAWLQPHFRAIALTFFGLAGSVAATLLQLLLVVVISAILWAEGERTANFLRHFAHRLAGPHGDRAVVLAGRAVRGVAMGVVLTALLQAVLAGIGLAVTGVPFAGVLTAVIMLLTIAQIGPLPILVPSVVWLYWKGDVTWGSALLVWTVVVAGMDNVIRPVLIKKGADLPLLLIFAGVIGGLIGFGIIGIFAGPVVLAVTYTLLLEWMRGSGSEPSAES